MIIILHTTQMAENLGAVARVMGNFALTELRLITPKISPLDPKALATAAGAGFILEQAKVFESLSGASFDIEHLFGTCADVRLGIRHYLSPDHLFNIALPEDQKMGVLFGCERSGLNQDDLSYCKGTVQIPVNAAFSSMNLSHAVGVVAYEHFKATQRFDNASSFTHFGGTRPANQAQKEALFQNLMKRLDTADYWRVPSKKPLMQQNLANLFFRLDVTEQEISTLFGFFDALRK